MTIKISLAASGFPSTISIRENAHYKERFGSCDIIDKACGL
jgi:hypothetical protein